MPNFDLAFDTTDKEEEELFEYHINLPLITLLDEDLRFLRKEPTLKTNSKLSGAEKTRDLPNGHNNFYKFDRIFTLTIL